MAYKMLRTLKTGFHGYVRRNGWSKYVKNYSYWFEVRVHNFIAHSREIFCLEDDVFSRADMKDAAESLQAPIFPSQNQGFKQTALFKAFCKSASKILIFSSYSESFYAFQS